MPLKPIISNLLLIVSMLYFGCFYKNAQHQKSIAKPIDTEVYNSSEIRKNNSNCYYKHFVGCVENDNFIKLNFNKENNEIYGNYFYTNSNAKLIFKGNFKNDSCFEIESTDNEYNILEKISGQIVNDSTVMLNIKNIKSGKNTEVKVIENYTESLNFTKAVKKTVSYLFENDTNIFCTVDLNYLQADEKKSAKVSEIIEMSYFNKAFSTISVYSKLDTFTNEVFADYKKLHNEEGFNPDFTSLYMWTIISDLQIIYNDNNLLSYSVDKYEFTGGAHGTSFILFNNIDLENNKLIGINDIFNENYETKLLEIILKKMLTNFGLSSVDELSQYLFDYQTVEITSNFYLDNLGIGFVYNQYEIAPYSEGQIYVFIPYSEISDLLKDDFVLLKK